MATLPLKDFAECKEAWINLPSFATPDKIVPPQEWRGILNG
jgi:hypothetical protein